MNEFIIQWYSRSIFNFQPSEIKQLFRKIETKSKQLITNNLHQEFNKIYIFVYIYIYECLYIHIYSENVKFISQSEGNCGKNIFYIYKIYCIHIYKYI